MKKRIKLFAIIQAILLMISYLTVSVYAGDGVTELPPIINNTAGENTFWHFDSSTGILEFVLFEEDKEGTIDINVINRWHDPQYDPGYDPRYAPWYNLRNQITRIEIDEGIVFIGNKSFYGCNKVTSLSLPESLREIGNEAFTGCKMKTLKLSDNITKIGYEAFMSCTALENIMLPKSLISIGDSGFAGCTSLKKIVVPKSQLFISDDLFDGCISLEYAVILNASCIIFGDLESDVAPFPAFTDIYGFKGSRTETFCEITGYNFIPIDGLKTNGLMLLGNLEADDNNFITGFDRYDPSIEDIILVSEQYEMNMSSSSIGTGTVITITDKNTGQVVDSYHTVVFGDLDADGTVDVFDDSILTAVTNYESEIQENAPEFVAADLTKDGSLDVFDLAIITSMANFES